MPAAKPVVKAAAKAATKAAAKPASKPATGSTRTTTSKPAPPKRLLLAVGKAPAGQRHRLCSHPSCKAACKSKWAGRSCVAMFGLPSTANSTAAGAASAKAAAVKPVVTAWQLCANATAGAANVTLVSSKVTP